MSSVVRARMEAPMKLIVTEGEVPAYVSTLVQHRIPTYPPSPYKFVSVMPSKDFFRNAEMKMRSGTFQCTGKTVTLYDTNGQHTHIFSHVIPYPNSVESAVYIQTWSHDPTLDLKLIKL
jgi:hypothetical protein